MTLDKSYDFNLFLSIPRECDKMSNDCASLLQCKRQEKNSLTSSSLEKVLSYFPDFAFHKALFAFQNLKLSFLSSNGSRNLALWQ